MRTHEIAVCICTFERVAGLRALLGGIERQRLVQLDHIGCRSLSSTTVRRHRRREACSAFAVGWRFRVSYRSRAAQGPDVRQKHRARRCAGERRVAHRLHRRRRDAGALVARNAGREDHGDAERPPPSGPCTPSSNACRPLACRSMPTPPGSASTAALSTWGTRAIPSSTPRFSGRPASASMPATMIPAGRTRSSSSSCAAGASTIAWAEDAIAHEVVPRRRMSARWLWLRWFRTGEVEAHLGSADPASAKGRLVSMARGLVRVGGGRLALAQRLADAPAGASRASLMWSTYTLCRGAGLIASAIGYRYRAYTTTRG